MTDIDPNEPPLFEIEDQNEQDYEDDGDVAFGALRLEGVDIPQNFVDLGNGKLPSSVLAPVGIGQHRLHPTAAAAFKRWRDESKNKAGIDLTLTDSYRSFDQQVDLKRRKGNLAATPGRSVHGFGFAVDVSTGMPPKGIGQTVLNWLKSSGPALGWHLGRPKDEPWHWVYRGPQEDVERPLKGLRIGSTGDDVKRMQSLLGVAADGQFGPKTEQALRAFQTANGLTADGVCGPKTLAALLKGSVPADRQELAIGSSGDAVRWLQRRLGITDDGQFGPRTEAAVKAFQTERGLSSDGRVGPATWAALTSA